MNDLTREGVRDQVASLPRGEVSSRELVEASLISLAAQLERVERWHEQQPPVRVSSRTTDGPH